MENNSAWKAMNRARNLLSLAYLAAKGVDDDPRRGLAEQFATLIDLIEDEVDNAMVHVAADERAWRVPNAPMAGGAHRSGQ
jgi:hypothetical protein